MNSIHTTNQCFDAISICIALYKVFGRDGVNTTIRNKLVVYENYSEWLSKIEHLKIANCADLGTTMVLVADDTPAKNAHVTKVLM